MKKAWNIIRKIIVWAIVVFSLGMMAFTIISVTTFDRADRSVFGYSAFIVLSDSMKATDFDAGDLVIIKQTDPSTLKEGDIISFQSPDETNYGEIVTHKIRELTTDEEGHPGFITYGTTTDSNDQGIVTYNLVIGKYQGHIPKVGTFFNFLKSVLYLHSVLYIDPCSGAQQHQTVPQIQEGTDGRDPGREEITGGRTCQIAGDDGTADADAAGNGEKRRTAPTGISGTDAGSSICKASG